MENPKNHGGEPTPPSTRISLAIAKIRVKAWLDAMATLPMFKDKPKQIPRALYISMKDITQLEEDCKKYYKHDKLEGIRIYFGLAGELEPITRSSADLRGMAVPVLKVPHHSAGKDAVYCNLENPDPNDTSIYDFTAPCPAYCDLSSELYLPVS
ncbi:hypothetical protein BDD43_3932 [Mucilaginibacter gracilis]|uniref:Uncharacterized protein n=1 Tax=Mucilaginibacter gracilis TaxID=423350 RepID=A0A495J5M1_9SPHI|nr:hypothetical protein [Mucilaginibacter gracilis]RKR83718.1 hypothetical protein BDD43_3932 [Mucilaginibacter gracilis]